MAAAPSTSKRIEHGDFQTPPQLAHAIATELAAALAAARVECASVVEPTCGTGELLAAALAHLGSIRVARGFDSDAAHVETARARLTRLDVDRSTPRGQIEAPLDARASSASLPRFRAQADVRVEQLDFHRADWRRILGELPEPILVLGNPPWVTNATLGALRSSNLPAKWNRDGLSGLEALTGKSNFDVSESMIVDILEALGERRGIVAMLCKTAVARKVLARAWRHGPCVSGASLHSIDAAHHFGVAVDAGLLTLRTGRGAGDRTCVHHATLDAPQGRAFGLRAERLVADVARYEAHKHLAGSSVPRWRSGIKHDAAKVMELVRDAGSFRNGHGERVEVEPDCIFPMLKSSQIACSRAQAPTRWMLVPQRSVGEPTERLRTEAPATWRYLEDHAAALDRRASSIYRGRARFAVFGVGPYSFAPWKVAISGFYKRLGFALVPPFEDRPVVLDDTGYFLPCRSRPEAELLLALLLSEPAQEFLAAFVFWDAKRPITIDLLGRLDLRAVARETGRGAEYERCFAADELRLERAAPSDPVALGRARRARGAKLRPT